MDPSKTQICLKVADGSLYPLIPAGNPGKKKYTIITAVKGQQKAVLEFLLKSSDYDNSTAKTLAVMEFEELKNDGGEVTFELVLEVDLTEVLFVRVKENAENRENNMEIPLHEWFTQEEPYNPGAGEAVYPRTRPGAPKIFKILLLLFFVILGIGLCLFIAYIIGQRLSVQAPPPLVSSVFPVSVFSPG